MDVLTKRWEKHSFIFFGVGCAEEKKWKCVLCEGNKIFEGGFKKRKLFFEALALEAVSVVVHVFQKMFVQSDTVSSL